MADVTYNTSSFPALLRTLVSLLALSTSHHDRVDYITNNAGDNPGGARERDDRGRGHDTLVLLAYKERDPAERQLWDMMTRETGVVLECVGKQAGAGGLPVEIWLGKRDRRRKGREAVVTSPFA
jgi:protein N-lysine methyltransferase METTL21D